MAERQAPVAQVSADFLVAVAAVVGKCEAPSFCVSEWRWRRSDLSRHEIRSLQDWARGDSVRPFRICKDLLFFEDCIVDSHQLRKCEVSEHQKRLMLKLLV